jgi:hypothetical protein
MGGEMDDAVAVERCVAHRRHRRAFGKVHVVGGSTEASGDAADFDGGVGQRV